MKSRSPKEYALFLLKIRDRSKGEIRQKMGKKGFESVDIDKTLDFLIEKQFIDDEKFAFRYVRSQIRMKPQGKYVLRLKMKRLFIDSDIIDQVLDQMTANDEEILVKEAANRWLVRNKNKPKEEVYAKLGRQLMSRGFSWEIVKPVLDQIVER